MLLSIKGISKQFYNHKALSAFSVEIDSNNIVGLLGPNGAGKTTLIRIITQILDADDGEVYFNGEKLAEKHRALIGYMPEERGLYKKMKVGEHLIYIGRLKGLSRADAVSRIKKILKKLDAEKWWNKKVEDLSKGMQQKIQFVATVLHNPQLIILDEPFSGLDPINSQMIEYEINDLRSKGATILFSTHRMEQVEDLCESIILINSGKKLLDGKVNDLKQQFKERIFGLQYTGLLNADFFYQFKKISEAEGSCRIQLTDSQSASDILQAIIQQPVQLLSFGEHFPGMNEIFIKCITENNKMQ